MVVPISETQFVEEVRGFIRDHAELNRLIAGEESSNRMIAYCASLAVDEWNVTPPLLGSVTFETFPSRAILLYLTIIHLLTSVGLLKARNRFAYNDGGFSVQTEEQEPLYKQWIQLLRSASPASDQNIKLLKVALNIRGGWGAGVGSEYGIIHGWYSMALA